MLSYNKKLHATITQREIIQRNGFRILNIKTFNCERPNSIMNNTKAKFLQNYMTPVKL